MESGKNRDSRRGTPTRQTKDLTGLPPVPGGGVFRFPREERLKGRDEIREVFNRRKAVSCPGARLLTLRNGLPYNRIAFTFSRKFGNAVARNRSRRLGREAYRHLRSKLRTGYDLVLLVYPEENHRSRGSVQKKPGRDNFSVRMEQMRELFIRAGLLNSTPNQEL